MIIIEVVMHGAGVLEYNILKSVPNILSPSMYINGLDKRIRNTAQCNALQYATTTIHHDLNNEHKVE